MSQQKKYDVGTFQPILLALRNKLTGGNVKVEFTISVGGSNYKPNKLGDWNLGEYLRSLQGQQGGKVELQLTPDGWNEENWGGDNPSSWGEKISESEIPNEMYRPATMTINMQDNKIQEVNISPPNLAFIYPGSKSRPSQIDESVWNQALSDTTKPAVLVLLQPIWIKAANFSDRPNNIQSPTLIVVHHTGGSRIGPTINTFTQKGGASAHYIIDTDGYVVKMVMNSKCAWHADGKKGSYWEGRKNVNHFSIGIEIVHEDGPKTTMRNNPFTEEQYKALIDLIKKLQKKYRISQHRVVGHSDVQIPPSHNCPGPNFDWKKLENEGLGLIPRENLIYPFEEDFPIRRNQKSQKRLLNDVISALKK